MVLFSLYSSFTFAVFWGGEGWPKTVSQRHIRWRPMQSNDIHNNLVFVLTGCRSHIRGYGSVRYIVTAYNILVLCINRMATAKDLASSRWTDILFSKNLQVWDGYTAHTGIHADAGTPLRHSFSAPNTCVLVLWIWRLLFHCFRRNLTI